MDRSGTKVKNQPVTVKTVRSSQFFRELKLCLRAPQGPMTIQEFWSIRVSAPKSGHAAPPGQAKEKPGSEDKAEGRGGQGGRARGRIKVGGSGPL